VRAILERVPITFHLLPEVVREIGSEYEVHLDTGIMSGADIVAAVALRSRSGRGSRSSGGAISAATLAPVFL
jgi:hypothetical protein